MKCMVCSSEKNTIFAIGQLDGRERNLPNPSKGLDVYQCSNCGLFFFDPMPTREQLRDYHGEQYFVSLNPLKQTGYPNYVGVEHLRVKMEWGKRILTWFRQFDVSQQAGKRVLDVGCAVGGMLEGMRKSGEIDAVGVDVSVWAIEWGEKHFPNIELHCGRLPEIELKGKFDYVLFWDSLEHDDDVQEVIESVDMLLSDDGLILIQTPDGGMAKKDWYYWSPHQHTCIFNEKNLGFLLMQHNLRVIKKKLSSEPDELIILGCRL